MVVMEVSGIVMAMSIWCKYIDENVVYNVNPYIKRISTPGINRAAVGSSVRQSKSIIQPRLNEG